MLMRSVMFPRVIYVRASPRILTHPKVVLSASPRISLCSFSSVPPPPQERQTESLPLEQSTKPPPLVSPVKNYIKRLKKAAIPAVGRKIIAEMSSQKIPWDEHLLSAAIKTCKRFKDSTTMVRLLEQAREDGIIPGHKKMSAIMSTVVDAGNDNEEVLLHLLRLWRNAGDDTLREAYAAAMSALLRVKDNATILALFNEMKSSGPEPKETAYRQAAIAYSFTGKWKEALALSKEMKQKGYLPNDFTYAVMIRAMQESDKSTAWERSLEILQEMKANGETPGTATYTAVMNACNANGQCQKTLALFQEMNLEGIERDRYSYSAAISALSKLGKWQERAALIKEMNQNGMTPFSDSSNGILFFSDSTAGSHSRLNQAEEALQSVEETRNEKQYYHSPSRAREALASLASQMKWEQVVDMIDCFLEFHSYEPWKEDLRHFARASAKLGQFDKLQALLDSLEERGLLQRSIWSALLDVCSEEMSWEQGLKYQHQIKRHGMSLSQTDYDQLILAFRESSEWQMVLHLLQEMHLNSFEPQTRTLLVAMTVCFNAEQWEEVIRLMNQVDGATVFRSLRMGMVSHFRLGNYSNAFEIFERMESQFGRLPTYVCNPMLKVCLFLNRSDKAEEIFSAMKAGPDKRPNMTTYRRMVHLYSSTGQWEKILPMLEEVTESDLQTETCSGHRALQSLHAYALAAYFNYGLYGDALGLLPRSIENEDWRKNRNGEWYLKNLKMAHACMLLCRFILEEMEPSKDFMPCLISVGNNKISLVNGSTYDIRLFLREIGGPYLEEQSSPDHYFLSKSAWTRWLNSPDAARFKERLTPKHSTHEV